ncbi:hypothetical protein ACSSS7_002779 [Eimeria intestinalis]
MGKFKPSELKGIKNAKKQLAKPKTQDAVRHKKLIYLHRRLKAFKGVRKGAWKVALGVQRLPLERGWTAPPAVLEVNLWKDIPEYEPEIWLKLNLIRFIMATLSILGATTGARQDQEEKEGTDGEPEPTVGSPTPLSLGGTGDGNSERDPTPLPCAQTSVPAASSVPSRSARTTATRPPPPPVPSPTWSGWLTPFGSGCWTLSASPPYWAPGQAASKEFLLGVQRTGRAWSTAIVPSAPAAVAQAPESEAATQPLERTDIVDRRAAELVAQPPPLEPLSGGDSPPPLPRPPPHLSPPHALGLDGLANVSASSTGYSSGKSGGDSSCVEVLEAALPAAKRHCPPGRRAGFSMELRSLGAVKIRRSRARRRSPDAWALVM